MLLKFPTTKTHFTFSAPAAQLIAAEMSQAHEQRTLFYLKGLGRFFIFISTSLPCGAQKKVKLWLEARALNVVHLLSQRLK